MQFKSNKLVKSIICISLLLVVMLLSGCASNPNLYGDGMAVNNVIESGSSVKVENGDDVTVDYTLRLENGTIMDTSAGRRPLAFTVGAGQMIKGFDKGVVGMYVNQTKNIVVLPEDGYGLVDQNKIVTINKSQFANFDAIEVGTEVGASASLIGVVVAKTDANITVDFNHRLAGKKLLFEVTLKTLKKATN
jgi:FKBP-type peptidyl-prolyl cis-trans isomerase 2